MSSPCLKHRPQKSCSQILHVEMFVQFPPSQCTSHMACPTGLAQWSGFLFLGVLHAQNNFGQWHKSSHHGSGLWGGSLPQSQGEKQAQVHVAGSLVIASPVVTETGCPVQY